MSRYILHVEDDETKARTVQRIIKAAFPHMLIVHIAHAKCWADAFAVHGAPLAVVTDYNLPLDERSAATPEGGLHIVWLCRRLHLPCIVVSGELAPVGWQREHPDVRFLDSGDWKNGLMRWAMGVTTNAEAT